MNAWACNYESGWLTLAAMLDAATDLLRELPLAGLMLVVTLGYIVGRVGWRGIEAGPAAGTLGVAMLAGYLGLTVQDIYGLERPVLTIGQLGFALFIYSVGFEAGPQAISSLRSKRGWAFVAVGASVVLLSVALAVGLAQLLNFDAATAAGVMAGALTSAPAYAAASEGIADAARLSVAFALTYPFGVLGLVLLIYTLPRLSRSELARSAEESEEKRSGASTPELTRAFNVQQPDALGRPLRELDFTNRTGCLISRIHRGDDVLIAGAETVLQAGDHVLAVGRLDELQQFERLVGPEVYSAELRERLPAPKRIHVAARGAVGRSLRELDLMGRYRCMVQRIERGRELLEPGGDVVLLRHDVVDVIGPRDAVRNVARELGRFEPDPNTTDIAIYAGGIVLGLLIGSIHFKPLGLDFSLGSAGGLLFMGVLLAWLRNVGPISANVPRQARQLVRDLGILLFVGETGIATGYSLAGGIELTVWPIIGAGALITLLPATAALLLARHLLRLRPVDAWGSVCGGMTSSAGLAVVKSAAESNQPAVSYAAAFAMASIMVTIAGQVTVRILSG